MAAGDAKRLGTIPAVASVVGAVRLVVTSPPYLDIVNYAKQNWIRSWLLEEYPDSELASGIDDNLTLGGWLDFMEGTALQIKRLMQPDGVLVMVIGDVANANRGSYISLARECMRRIRHDSVFRYVGCFEDYIGQDIKTTRIWKDTKGRATEVDRLIILSDDTPRFRTTDLPETLGLPGLSKGALRHISADALARTAKTFTNIGESRTRHGPHTAAQGTSSPRAAGVKKARLKQNVQAVKVKKGAVKRRRRRRRINRLST